MKNLLGIKNLDESLLQFGPLSRAEEKTFYDGFDHSSRPKITAENFRFNLSEASSDPFNREAQNIFVEDFIQAVNKGLYSDLKIPSEFLVDRVVRATLISHMKHVYSMYHEARSKKAKELRTERVRRAGKASRKRTVCCCFAKIPLINGI